MSRKFLEDVLDKFAELTNVLIKASNIKDNLEQPKLSNEELKDVFNETKECIEQLCKHSENINSFFFEKCEEMKRDDESLEKQNGLESNSEKKPAITLVDINKLVEPKRVAPVVVISSDEDDNDNDKSNKQKTRRGKSKKVDDNLSGKRELPSRSVSSKVSTKSKTVENMVPTKENGIQNSDSKSSKVNRSKVSNRGKKSKPLEEVHLSISSLSSDDTDLEVEKSDASKSGVKSKGKNKLEPSLPIDVEGDPKFKAECFVNIFRVPCEKLKEYYLSKLELLEINKLTNKRTLKRKRTRGDRANSKESSDDEQQLLKKKDDNIRGPKRVKKHAGRGTTKSSSSSSDDSTAKTGSKTILDAKEATGGTEQIDDQLASAELALDLLESDDQQNNKTMSDSEQEAVEENGKEKERQQSKDAADKVSNEELPDDKKTEENMETHEGETSDKEKETDANAKGTKKGEDRRHSDETDDGRNCTDSDEGKTNARNCDGGEGKDETTENKSKSSDEDEKKANTSKSSSDEDTPKKKKEKSNEENSSDDSEKKKKKSKETWKKDKLLTDKLSSSDSEELFQKARDKKEKKKQDEGSSSSDEEIGISRIKKKRKTKKKAKKAILTDSENDGDNSCNEDSSSDSSHDSEEDKQKSDEETKKKRKRVKRVKDSSDDDDDKVTRKQIRNILGRDSLAETTKKAEAEERERKARLSEKQKKYNQVYVDLKNASVDKVVLDFDEKSKTELVKVDDNLVSKLKPHQASGIQFMWDACFESLERTKTTKGSGCILAHCMGLGKTLQVIALSHTLLTKSEETKVRKVLVVSPLNTVLNWVSEYKQWIPENNDYEVFELVSMKQNYERQYQVKEWHNCGGVLIIGYDMFRNLSNPENKRISKKMRQTFHETLVDPGPDLVVCDEGHLLKNEKTGISIAMNRIRTMRRIVLTGTPLQNNLKEYWCMVQFIKPNLLGTYKEYLNRFVNPITNGQYTDSTPHDIQIMRKRSHVLHKMLDGVVQRRDYSVLAPYLPPKNEYVLFLNLTEIQINLYRHYMDHYARRNTPGSGRVSFLFADFQALQRICTHPRVLLDKSREDRRKTTFDDEEDSEGSLRDFVVPNDEDESSSSGSNSSESDAGSHKDESKNDKLPSRKRMTRAALAQAKENGEEIEILDEGEAHAKEWWQEYIDGEELERIHHSSKLYLLFEILKECEEIGDKVLVFSQSLYSLNVIEYFLAKISDATEVGNTVDGFSGSWLLGLDYFRLDGSSSCDNRSTWCKSFNEPSNTRARLFLISTRAGGLGINLVAANRVIIFDVSWNPSHDIQSIYRVYRFGQNKPCYIYRFVTNGTMEMKVYERQVTKQAISKRVIDEQQIDRHYNQNDLAELYKFDPSTEDRPTPMVPKDVFLGEMLQNFADRIYKYHEHQTLLENKEDEVLNEEERKAAWEEFENEKQQRHNFGAANQITNQLYIQALVNLIQRENPTWTDKQIRSSIPALQLQLQEQVQQGDLSLYKRLNQEVQVIRFREQAFQKQQQQLTKIMQQQYGKYPGFPSTFNNDQVPGTSGLLQDHFSPNPSEIIDLND